MNSVTVTMLVMLVVFGVVGLCMARMIRNGDSFYIMEEKAPTLFLVCGICMSYISAVTMNSGPGICYEQGPLILLTTAQPGAWLGMIVAILFIGRKMKSIGCYTLPDYFTKRFSDNNVSFFAVIIMAVGLELYGVGQIMSISSVLSDVTGLSYECLVVIFTLAVMSFCVPGGTWGVMMTETCMFAIVFVTALVVCPVVLHNIMPEAVANLPREFWQVGGVEQNPMSFSISQFFLWFMFFAGSPVIITRVFPAKNDFAVCKACVISVALIALIAASTYLTAGMMRGVDPNIVPPDKVMLTAFLEYVPRALGLIGVMGIITAATSTAAVVFSLTGFAISRDLYGVLNQDKPEAKNSVGRARLVQFFVIALGGMIAYFQPASIFDISVFVCGIFAASWLPAILLGLVWKRFSSAGAFYGMLTGISALVILQFFISFRGVALPAELNQYIVSVALSILVSVVVSLRTPSSGVDAVNHYRIQNALPSDMIFTRVRKSPKALPRICREYRMARRVIIVTAALFFLICVGLAMAGGGALG